MEHIIGIELDEDQEAFLYESLDEIHRLISSYYSLYYQDIRGTGEDQINFRFPYIKVEPDSFDLTL